MCTEHVQGSMDVYIALQGSMYVYIALQGSMYVDRAYTGQHVCVQSMYRAACMCI